MMPSKNEREQMRRQIATYSRKLMLSSAVVELCATDATPRQEQFLHRVLSEELDRRERDKRARLLKRAGFPVLKSFAEYEFSGIRFPPDLSKDELLSCRLDRKSTRLNSSHYS